MPYQRLSGLRQRSAHLYEMDDLSRLTLESSFLRDEDATDRPDHHRETDNTNELDDNENDRYEEPDDDDDER